MRRIKFNEAEKKLPELFELVKKGEEVIIIADDGNCYKITSMEQTKPKPKFGSAAGLIKISDDFEAPLDDFEEYL